MTSDGIKIDPTLKDMLVSCLSISLNVEISL